MAMILVVEDDALIRTLAEAIIAALGHEVLSAPDVRQAMAILRSARRIDVLFTDISLMERCLGGCELAVAAQRLRPRVGVIYATGGGLTPELSALFVARSRFLSKPYTSDQIEGAISHVLAA
jgi:DNA-binding NtrC family response regulator